MTNNPKRKNYLLDEKPLIVLPSLAVVLGLQEAIVLQQVQYWLVIASEMDDDIHFQEGRWWTWHSYPEWEKEMPWWSYRTIRRILERLRNKGLLIARDDLSKNKFNRSLWYSIDYEALDVVVQGADWGGQVGQVHVSNMDNSMITKLDRSTYTDITTDNTLIENEESTELFEEMFGKSKAQADQPEFTAVDMLDENRRQLMQEHLLNQRRQRLDNQPWLQFNPGRYTRRGEIEAEHLQYIDWIIYNETGLRCTSPKKKVINGWISGLEEMYYAGNGNRKHIITGVRVTWNREAKYQPSDPRGFVAEIRKAAAVGKGKTNYRDNRNEGGRSTRFEVVHIEQGDE